MATKGSRKNPYTQSEYNAMNNWQGGWVLYEASLMKYVDSNDSEYDDSLGSQDNPCPLSVYNEMLSNDIWEGGWVQDPDGIHYVQGFTLPLIAGSGCGSGSGYGSGSGCGCGGTGLLVAGSATYRPDVFSVNTYLEITWGNGSFLNGGQPPLSVELINEDHLNISNFHYSWENFYRIKITFTLGNYYDYNYNIPDQYRR